MLGDCIKGHFSARGSVRVRLTLPYSCFVERLFLNRSRWSNLTDTPRLTLWSALGSGRQRPFPPFLYSAFSYLKSFRV
ncbi:Cystatin domain-containing protein [Psidium guajava]|nr:Cystatin domain-containing protein [Psidium guajava]